MANVKAALARVSATIKQLEGAEWGSPANADIQKTMIVDEWVTMFAHRPSLVASRAGMRFLEGARRLLTKIEPAVAILPETIVDLVARMLWLGCPQMAWWAACRLGQTLTPTQINEAWEKALDLAVDHPPTLLDRLDYWHRAYAVIFSQPTPGWWCPIWNPYLSRAIVAGLRDEQYDRLEAGACVMGTDVVALLALMTDHLAEETKTDQSSYLAPAVHLLRRSYESGGEARQAIKDRLPGWWFMQLMVWSHGYLQDIHRQRLVDDHRAGDTLAEAGEIEARLRVLQNPDFTWYLAFSDSPWQLQVKDEVARLQRRLPIVREFGPGVNDDGEPDLAALDALDVACGDEGVD